MKLESVKLKNFRAYREETKIEINDFTAFIWKNDAWKSTVLEALDIFFNEKQQPTIEDLNINAKNAGEDFIEITCLFSDLPSEIDIDWWNKTSLEKELLLNEEWFLEIKKVFKGSTFKWKPFIIAYHIEHEVCWDLLSLKQSNLKKIVNDNQITCENNSINETLRESIREYFKNECVRETKEIDTSKEWWKIFWEKIKSLLPSYFLFESDRKNNDQDSEVQDPINAVIKDIFRQPDVEEKLKAVSELINQKAAEITGNTLEKLEEMNSSLSDSLTPVIPEYEKLKWSSVFKWIWIESSNWIPLNKRWSWVRRMILLNFFRAEAEKEWWWNWVIYAIEEPETAQHPEHQKMLIDALIWLSENSNKQVLLTTHSPNLVKYMNHDNLKYIVNENWTNKILDWSNMIHQIVKDLGVIPDIQNLLIFVEWAWDENFLRNINNNIPELNEIIDISCFPIIPLWWSNLTKWIDKDYLQWGNAVEFHLYDRDDDEKYKNSIEVVNQRSNNDKWLLTNHKEIENYIHPKLIEEFFITKGITKAEINISLSEWLEFDVPNYFWSKLNVKDTKAKTILNEWITKNITKSHLEELWVWEEVKLWFEEIKRLHRISLADEKNERSGPWILVK